MKYRSTLEQKGSSGIFSDNNAISTVVGAILILGLVVSCIAFVEVHYVPSWGADDEARHLRDVFVDFSTVPSRIDTLVLANDTDTVSKQRIKLGIGDMPFMAPGKSWGAIGAVPREGNFRVEANNVWMVNTTRNGTLLHTFTDEGLNIINVSSISVFDINILEMASNSWIYINLTKHGNQSGGAGINYTANKLTITTWGDDDKITDEVAINKYINLTLPVQEYSIDLLNPCYGFSKVLSDTEIPYNLTITNSTDVDGWYYTDYYNLTRKDYSITSNGTLVYKSMNRYFIDQKFIYQNGAVFLCQPPDASMRITPGITIENMTDNKSARMTIPMVTVVASEGRIPMIGGSGVEELQLELDHADRIALAEAINTNIVNITIEAPDGNEDFRRNYLWEWVQYFDKIVKPPVYMKQPSDTDFNNDNTSVNITLNGSIRLEIRDIEIDGRVTHI
ncbi:MAG: hypothetical protein U9N43_01525 [Euryarchaeota archaeon]|nr:hypothetical protein [Euryarchaeota archaeon]